MFNCYGQIITDESIINATDNQPLYICYDPVVFCLIQCAFQMPPFRGIFRITTKIQKLPNNKWSEVNSSNFMK